MPKICQISSNDNLHLSVLQIIRSSPMIIDLVVFRVMEMFLVWNYTYSLQCTCKAGKYSPANYLNIPFCEL